jgi:hypothetical protein
MPDAKVDSERDSRQFDGKEVPNEHPG